MNVKRWSRLGAGLAAAVLVASTAQAQVYAYTATLSGPAEAPPNASPGTGTAWVWYTPALHSLRIAATFSGLTANTTAAHIHCCVDQSAVPSTAGVAVHPPSLAGFPLGVMSGSFDQTYDLRLASSFSNAFIMAAGGTVALAEQRLFQGLNEEDAYFNIHTSAFPGGEIRGFLTAVPEPSTYALMGTGLMVLGGLSWRRRRA